MKVSNRHHRCTAAVRAHAAATHKWLAAPSLGFQAHAIGGVNQPAGKGGQFRAEVQSAAVVHSCPETSPQASALAEAPAGNEQRQYATASNTPGKFEWAAATRGLPSSCFWLPQLGSPWPSHLSMRPRQLGPRSADMHRVLALEALRAILCIKQVGQAKCIPR